MTPRTSPASTRSSTPRARSRCSDHNCLLRVCPRGGMGTNGGCHCVDRNSCSDGLLSVKAERLDLVRLLTLARQTPALVAEVRRLRACDSVSETLAENSKAMLGRAHRAR